jgi:hypothetical protein
MIICNLYAFRHIQSLIIWQGWMDKTKQDRVACQKNLVYHGMRACVNGAITETQRAPFFKGTRKHSYQASAILKGEVTFPYARHECI